MLTDGLNINEKGHLTIGGCDTVELAETYGTPLYVMNEEVIRQALRAYVQSMETYYPQGGRWLMPARLAVSWRCTASPPRRAVERTWCPAESSIPPCGRECRRNDCISTATTNRRASCAWHWEAGVGRIVVDNPAELRRLSSIAQDMGSTAAILLRVTPGIDAHTHQFIRTGQIDSKFGLTLENGEALAAAREALSLPGIDLKGFHCHIGSQIFDVDPFAHAADVMLRFMARVRGETGATLTELNLGWRLWYTVYGSGSAQALLQPI